LAEAYTGTSKTTDLGFSYTNRGEAATVYQSSPHSGGYYHLAATYWAPQGLLDTLNPNMTGIPTWTYTPEGEGRVNTVSASAGQNPVTATSYNDYSEATGITFGSGDADAFSYDPYTGRMTQYKATINGQAMYGNLTWSQNFTLNLLAITDPFNSANVQTCGYGYDDLARVNQVDCGTGKWGQSFNYVDNATNNLAAFGNISKSVLASHTGSSFSAAYSDTTNRLTTIGSTTVTYDSNGNVTYDGFHHYTWDGEGNLATLDSNPETYDAFDRRVEQSSNGTYTEIVFGPAGNKLALMSGQTVTKVFTPLSGGATAVYTSSGLQYYRHSDWLGSSRLASGTNRTVYYDGAYAPFGEPYAETGTTDRDFTGQNQDLTPGSTGDLYDFLYREYHPTQGRWVSPDPAGLNAANPANPQSWNRYAYVMNNPLGYTDPLGLDYCAPGSQIFDGSGSFVGYDDSQCISDDQYGDGTGYAGYIYVGAGDPVNVDSSSSGVAASSFDPFGALSWASNQLSNAATRALTTIKNSVVCPALNATLGTAADATHHTVGVGYGGGAGVGLVLGVSGGGSLQAVADQQGNYGIAISLQGNPGWGVYGASANAGYQFMQSNAATIYDLRGWGADASFSIGDEVALGIDYNVAPDGTSSVTTTLGPGVGLRYSGSGNASHTWVPLSIHCGG
jgi:RHS repeat-associated protein